MVSGLGDPASFTEADILFHLGLAMATGNSMIRVQMEGLRSVQRRLYLLYARPDLVQTQQHENQFTTTVTIPQNYDQVPHN